MKLYIDPTNTNNILLTMSSFELQILDLAVDSATTTSIQTSGAHTQPLQALREEMKTLVQGQEALITKLQSTEP
ncbi:hypothetical protein NIES4103_31170 [Nostoc sp. NIES-4103]|nr:hypothetical protein NIES4103_31170 [Nostoc sp. NIES-4103]